MKLPYADAPAYGDIQYSVGDAITPLEWYALIKHSQGYVGNNMHPIVTSITNGVPFFCFDNYGIAKIDGEWTNGESSKIYHILQQADLLEYRVFISGKDYLSPNAEAVLKSITSFNMEKEKSFASNYYQEYLKMMEQVYKAIKP